MKTTIDISGTLLAHAKAFAARERISVTQLIEEGLRLRLRSNASPKRARRRAIPVFHGKGGLAVGVNPLNHKALLQAAERL